MLREKKPALQAEACVQTVPASWKPVMQVVQSGELQMAQLAAQAWQARPLM